MKPRPYSSTKEVDDAGKLLKDGVLIAQRKEGFYKVLLYQVSSSYIEVFVHEHFNVIIKVNNFTNTCHLEPFLAAISIDGLLRGM